MQDTTKDEIINITRLCLGVIFMAAMVWASYTFGTWMIGYAVTNQTTSINEERTSIVSLYDSTLSGGSFFLGIGSISEKPQFFYYAKTGQSYNIRWVPADMTTVIEDEENDPHISKLQEVETTCHANGNCNAYSYYNPVTYEIHVPKGTVRRTFDLNGV